MQYTAILGSEVEVVIDTVKFFNKQSAPSHDAVVKHHNQSAGITSYEARKRVEDTVDNAMRTVTELEKLYQTSLPGKQPTQSPNVSSPPPIRDEKKHTIEACKKARFWLTAVKAKFFPSYLPLPDEKQAAAPTLTPTVGTPAPRPKLFKAPKPRP